MQDIQKTLNIIRNQIDAVDAETKWATVKLMLAPSASVVALAKKLAKPDPKPVTPIIAFFKTKILKKAVQQTSKPNANNAVQTALKPITLQKPLSNQKIS